MSTKEDLSALAFANSLKIKNESEDRFRTMMGTLIVKESNRRVYTHDVRKIVPTSGDTVIIPEVGEVILNELSTTQLLGIDPTPLNTPNFKGKSNKPLYDTLGNPIPDSNSQLNEFWTSIHKKRKEALRQAIVEKDIETQKLHMPGHVGTSYPADLKDSRAIKSIWDAVDGVLEPTLPTINRFGTVKVSFNIPEMSFKPSSSGDIYNVGIFYKNNPYGFGNTETGLTMQRLICTNGMFSRHNLSFSIPHYSMENYFIRMWNRFRKVFKGLEWFEEEPFYQDIVKQTRYDRIHLSDNVVKESYDLFGKGVVLYASQEFDKLKSVITNAYETDIVDFDKELEAQAEKHGFKRQVSLIKSVIKQDNTMRDFNTIGSILEALSRTANVYADSNVNLYESLQEKSYDIALEATPLITA